MQASSLILHVEDDPIDVGNLKRAFARCGIGNPVRSVRTPQEALNLLRGGIGGARVQPALILLDLGLPGMGGLELLRELKADRVLRRIPVVAFSASRNEVDLESAYDLGVAGYVVKPMDFEGFVRAIAAVERYWALCEIP
jgi:CheY-like chemotaxis protein